ncbi:hypothetical protein MMC07_006053 [Pseudocyphellaria aurata]|nr:hypothetical protein [Pseudocyphellaria aurata]
MLRPGYQRASSTNLSAGVPARPLEGKVAIVTGASRGIGAAIARNLAAKGVSLILNYTSDSSKEIASDLASSLQSTHGIKAISVQADMGDPNGPEHLVTTAKNNFSHAKTGKFQLDIIINNAGIALNLPLEKTTPDAFTKLYAINVLGPILLVQAALPYLPHDRSGRIVNVSSVSSSLGFYGQTLYGGTKAALEAMTRTWSRELAERATVNAINPGPVATDMYEQTTAEDKLRMKPFHQTAPLMNVREGVDDNKTAQVDEQPRQRWASADEIAGVVAMLCSEDGAWCTGSVVCANGGLKFST